MQDIDVSFAGLPKPQNQFAVKGSATVALESIQPTSPNTIKPASPSTTNSDLWKKTNLKILKDEMVPKVSLGTQFGSYLDFC